MSIFPTFPIWKQSGEFAAFGSCRIFIKINKNNALYLDHWFGFENSSGSKIQPVVNFQACPVACSPVVARFLTNFTFFATNAAVFRDVPNWGVYFGRGGGR
ncbi:hypothetical protein [Roseovarius pacificus]|uniref:hypothetical protein n=1 Tax=Roseovarius pacificus TaxID=337701 RepID=UPI004039FB37